MVWSGRIVVAISINGFYCSRSLHHSSVNDCELSLAIYVQGKIFQGSYVSTKYFTIIKKYFLLNSFQTTVFGKNLLKIDMILENGNVCTYVICVTINYTL